MNDIRQTPQYAKYLKNIGWIVEEKKGVYYFIKKIPFIGSIIKIQRPETIDFKYIDILAVKYNAFQIVLEPNLTSIFDSSYGDLLYKKGFKQSKNPYLPTKTLKLDLTQSRDDLFKQMKKDTKYALKKAPILNSELQMQNYKNIEMFKKAWKKAVGLKRYTPPLSQLRALKRVFKENCLFLLVACSQYYDSNHSTRRGLAGAVFLIGDNIGYYWQAFTNTEGRKLMAQYRIVWEGILWAKKNGAKLFDFEGIYDERFPNKSWLGFSHFKKSFGGYEVEYPGCYNKFRLPL